MPFSKTVCLENRFRRAKDRPQDPQRRLYLCQSLHFLEVCAVRDGSLMGGEESYPHD